MERWRDGADSFWGCVSRNEILQIHHSREGRRDLGGCLDLGQEEAIGRRLDSEGCSQGQVHKPPIPKAGARRRKRKAHSKSTIGRRDPEVKEKERVHNTS